MTRPAWDIARDLPYGEGSSLTFREWLRGNPATVFGRLALILFITFVAVAVVQGIGQGIKISKQTNKIMQDMESNTAEIIRTGLENRDIVRENAKAVDRIEKAVNQILDRLGDK